MFFCFVLFCFVLLVFVFGVGVFFFFNPTSISQISAPLIVCVLGVFLLQALTVQHKKGRIF